MLKKLGMAIAALVVAGAGLYFGMATRQAVSSREEAIVAPTSTLADSTTFPNVPVRGEDGRTHQTHDLLGPGGSVVIFMSLGCAPCKEMVAEWQRYLTAGKLGDIPLVAIADSQPDVIQIYKANNNITFPIYADTTHVFMSRYSVDEYPLRLMVDGGHIIRSHTYDPSADEDLAETLKAIGR